jgi:tetratricopeptide (TPR) repeat protein
MATKRRPKSETSPAPSYFRSLGWFLAFVLVASAAFALYRFAAQQAPEVPDADRSVMEPQVAQKIQAHREAVFASPDSAEAWEKLGVVFQAHGLTEEASRCYRKALELAPGEFRAQYLLVHALRAFDREKALAESARALELGRDYAPIYVIRGELVEDQGDLGEAKALYEKALELDSDNAMALVGLGRIEMGEDQLDEARHHLERARDANPEAGSVRALLARLYRRIGEEAKAAEEAQRASLAKEPVGIEDPIHFRMTQESVASTAQLRRAQAAEKAGDYGSAEKIFRDLVSLRPDDADLRAGLGDALARQERRAEAKEQYLAAIELSSDQAGALYGLATLLSLEGQYEEAVAYYRRSVAARPDHVASLTNLASLLAFQGQTEEALNLFGKALELDPDSVSTHRALADLYFRQKDWAKAIRHYEKVLEEKSDLGAVEAQLGACLAMSGRFPDAWSHFSRARELGAPVPPDLFAEVERRVKAGER